ncbi:MAG: hypothetical protein II961_09850 [Candidatus Riflebacteria bacterium]|nr:hypothetical protein [Candidatus Riflebacteria bacterium]
MSINNTICHNKLYSKLAFILLCFLSIFLLGCNEGDSSHANSSASIGLDGYSEDDRLRVEISHRECRVGETISFAVTCRDAGGALLKDISVLFSSDNGGEFSDTSVKTDDFGTAGVSFTPSKEGITMISVNASGISKQIAITVLPSQAETIYCFGSASSDVVKPKGSVIISVLVANSSNIGIKDAEVNLSCQYGTLKDTSGKTDDRGYFSTTYTAPSEVGVEIITVVALQETVSIKISIRESDEL